MTERYKRIKQRKDLETEVTEDNKSLCDMISSSITPITKKHGMFIHCSINEGTVSIHPRINISGTKTSNILYGEITLKYPDIHTWFRTEKILKDRIRAIDKDLKRLKTVLGKLTNLRFIEESGKVAVILNTRNRYF